MKYYLSIAQELKAYVKDVDGKKGIVTGYFSAFNNVDADGDMIMPGAFLKSISETGPNSTQPRIKHLLNHSTGQPIGKLMELKEDSYGLYYESQIGSHNLGVDFVKMVVSGLITEHSIGYKTIKRRDHDTLTVERWGDQVPVRQLIELQLWEGSSLTAWGANEMTPLTGLKSLTADQALVRIPLLKSAIKNGTFTDATFEILVAELSAIEQAFKELSEGKTNTDGSVIDAIKSFSTQLSGTTQPDGNSRTTEPNGADLLDAMKSFSLQLN